MRLDDGGLQHDEGEIFVDADVHVGQAFHDRLVFADAGGDEFQEIVVAARDQMAFDHLVHLLDGRQEAGEIDLPVVLEGDFGEDGERLPELADIDLRRIAVDIAFGLQLLHSHQAGAGREIDQLRQLDIGDAAVLLQFVEDLDVDPVQFHVASAMFERGMREGSIKCCNRHITSLAHPPSLSIAEEIRL